jgi:ribosomal protein S18 acetylase RimI-like enzyme
MTMRLMRLPADLELLGEMLTESFQYPENEAWNVQTDVKEQLISTARNLQRIWFLIRFILLLSPSLRDVIRGYVWEEDGRLVGITVFQRRGSTGVWVIGPVGVLPAYRRRGIARKLMVAGLDLMRERGGKTAVLDVIDGNVPARTLYENLRFEHYGDSVELYATPEKAIGEPSLPKGYTQSLLNRFDWRPHYDLEQSITPERSLKYEPVEIDRYRQPKMMRLLAPLIMYAQRISETGFAIHTSTEGRIVARGRCTITKRGKGTNRLEIRLDPDHIELAPYLVRYLLYMVTTKSPGNRVELSVPEWMKGIITAAEEAGFKHRMKYRRMGLSL